jgi:hypothetical protein
MSLPALTGSPIQGKNYGAVAAWFNDKKTSRVHSCDQNKTCINCTIHCPAAASRKLAAALSTSQTQQVPSVSACVCLSDASGKAGSWKSSGAGHVYQPREREGRRIYKAVSTCLSKTSWAYIGLQRLLALAL